MEEIENYKAFCRANLIPIPCPNTMNNNGVILDDFGFHDMLHDIMVKVVSPLAKKLWSGMGEDSLDHHHGMTVEYGLDKDRKLDLHRDNAEITINYCLGTTFKGGTVRFEGMRCLEHIDVGPREHEIFEYENVPGMAMIHPGRHKHLAKDIESGDR